MVRTRLHLGLERNHIAVLPQIHRHGLAGIDRRGEPRDVLSERGRIVIGVGLQDPAAGDAVGAHAVQDRLCEAGALGEFGIGVQRVAVAAKPIHQRLVRAGRDIDGPVGRAGRHLVRFRLAFGRPAKAAVAARKTRRHQCRQWLALLVLQHGLVADHRALVLALVEDVEHARVGGDVGGYRQRLVEGDVAFAIDHHHPVEIHFTGPGAPGRHRRKCRHHLQRTRGGDRLVDERQFLFVHRVGAEPDAMGVQHHFAIGVGVFLAEVLQRHQLVVLDRHFWSSPDFFLLLLQRFLSSPPRKRGSSNHRR